jgi:putative oxidoreductase
MIATNILPDDSSKVRLITLWILSGLLALVFLGSGGAKLVGAAAMVEMFDKLGRGQWFRYFTGLLEILGGIGLLIPRFAFYAAGLLAVIMVGAIIAHLTLLGISPAVPIVLLVLSGIIVWLRKP